MLQLPDGQHKERVVLIKLFAVKEWAHDVAYAMRTILRVSRKRSGMLWIRPFVFKQLGLKTSCACHVS